jgi:hypothetical protein
MVNNFKEIIMKATNKDLKRCRDELSKLQSFLFSTLGGEESYKFRIELGNISNSILNEMKANEINGDETVSYF